MSQERCDMGLYIHDGKVRIVVSTVSSTAITLKSSNETRHWQVPNKEGSFSYNVWLVVESPAKRMFWMLGIYPRSKVIGQTNGRKNYKYENVISGSEVWVATEGWQIIQQKHQHEFVLFPSCSRDIFGFKKGSQRPLVWQGVAVLAFSSVRFLPDTGCWGAGAPKDAIAPCHRTKGCGSSGVRFALSPCSKEKLEPREGWLAPSLRVSAACRASLVSVLVLLAVHTVNMERRRCRKTEISIRPAQSLLYRELMIGRATLMSARREILSPEPFASRCGDANCGWTHRSGTCGRPWTVSYSALLQAVNVIILWGFPRAVCLLSLMLSSFTVL